MSATTFCPVYDQKRKVGLQDLLVYGKKTLSGVIGKPR